MRNIKGKSTFKFFRDFLKKAKMIGVGFPGRHKIDLLLKNGKTTTHFLIDEYHNEETENISVIPTPIYKLNGKYYAEIIQTRKLIVSLTPSRLPDKDKNQPPFYIDKAAIRRTKGV